MGRAVADIPYDPSKPLPKLRILFNYPLVNVPGFSAVGLAVYTPPGGATPPHHHAGVSVVAVVVSGSAYNKMNSEPTMLLQAGESFYEAPGCHHKASVNASDTEEMTIHATVIVETKVFEEIGMKALQQFDDEWKDIGSKISLIE